MFQTDTCHGGDVSSIATSQLQGTGSAQLIICVELYVLFLCGFPLSFWFLSTSTLNCLMYKCVFAQFPAMDWYFIQVSFPLR